MGQGEVGLSGAEGQPGGGGAGWDSRGARG